MSTHTYWRINIAAVAAGFSMEIAEIEMRATVGGADQCSGGTATASYTWNPASFAFNDNALNEWTTNGQANTGWIKYQFASPVDVAEYTIQASASHVSAPKNFTLEYSDNDSDWYVADTVSNCLFLGERVKRTFTIGDTSDGYEYWRIKVSAHSAGGERLRLQEIEFKAVVDGSDLTDAGETYNAAADYGWESPLQSFDNNTSTTWDTYGSSLPNWIAFIFQSRVEIVQYTIQAEDDSYAPKDWTLEVSHDGTTWDTVDTVTGETSWGAPEKRTFLVAGGGGGGGAVARPVVFFVT